MLIGHRLAVFSGVLGSFNIRAKTVSLFNYSPVSYSAAPQLQPFAAFFGGGIGTLISPAYRRKTAGKSKELSAVMTL